MQEEDGRNKKKLKWLQRMGECGIWISLTPHKLNGTLLSRDEWLDNTRLCYGFKPMGLCSHCDGCAAPFTVEHELSCKKGGLVSIRHDNARDKAGALVGQALTTRKITYEPSISYGRNLTAGQPSILQGTGNKLGAEARCDVLVHGLWERGAGASWTSVLRIRTPTRTRTSRRRRCWSGPRRPRRQSIFSHAWTRGEALCRSSTM